MLKDVLYGDVWVCAGQSNMQMGMGEIENSTEEMNKMAEYPNIRMYSVDLMTSNEPQDDLLQANIKFDFLKFLLEPPFR